MPSKNADKNYEKLPLSFFILCGIAAFSLIIYLVAVISPGFAAWFNGSIGAFFRALLAHLTSWLPFSLAEILLYCVPVVVVLVAVYAFKKRCATWKSTFVYIGCILSVCSIFFSLFVFGFGTGYHTPTLDQRLELSVGEVTVDDLYQTAKTLALAVNDAAKEVEFGEDSFSKMPYSRGEMNDKLLDAYDKLCDDYDFVQRLRSRIKPVIASEAMSYTHITGVYAYFTGEANLNVAFPDYTLPFTAAHELAHQRGIARENEANFIAFLVTSQSEDAYIRYCGYLNLFEYVFAALQRQDSDMAKEIVNLLDRPVVDELVAYAAFFERYSDSVAADISDFVNDTYLKVNGNKEGTASYGLVVDLAVAYYKK